MHRAALSALFAIGIATASVITMSAASAQQPATRCTTLLTTDEISKAVVAGFRSTGVEEKRPGESSCTWMLVRSQDDVKIVGVKFYTPAAIKTDLIAPTVDKYFEFLVSTVEQNSHTTRELLTGIGVKSAFVTGVGPTLTAFIQRTDGVAYIFGTGVTKAQITALAKAVMTP